MEEVQKDIDIQLACQRDRPYIRLLTVLGVMTVLLATVGFIIGMMSFAANLSLLMVGVILMVVSAIWEKQDDDKLAAIQDRRDDEGEQEDLAMRRESY